MNHLAPHPVARERRPRGRLPRALAALTTLVLFLLPGPPGFLPPASACGNGSGAAAPEAGLTGLPGVADGLAAIPIASPSGFTFPRSVPGVSGYNSDCHPSMTADGHQLYFISTDNNGPPYGDEHYGTGFNVYVARWNGAAWDSVTNLGPNVNPAGYSCISADGLTLYVTRSSSIMRSTFDGTGWTPVTRLPWPVNDSLSTNRAPFITADGHQLYFASNRFTGAGGYDLWVVRWNGAAWDSLTHLGPNVNTAGSETHPSVTPDGTTLYFSDFSGSRDNWKYGDADLYRSHWTGSGWGPAAIVGSPVNSDRPLCSSFPLADGRMLVSSGVSEGGFGEEDVWMLLPDSTAGADGAGAGDARADAPGPTPRRRADDWVRIASLPGAMNIHCLIEGADGTLYAGTAPNGDVFRSPDGGATWEAAADLPGVVQVYSLLEASDGTLYAGTYPSGDVYRSSDGGDSWTATADMPHATAVRALLEASDGVVYAGTSPDSLQFGRVYRTTDRGTTWTRTATLPNVKGGIFTLAEGADGAIFAGGRVSLDRIFVTPNGGATWFDIDLPYDDRGVTISNTWFIRATSDGTLWAGGWAHGPQMMLAHSTDNGASWDTTASIMMGQVEAALLYDMVEEADGSLLLGFHPGPDSIVVRSTDGGVTWAGAGRLPGARETLCLLRTSDGSIFAGTSADGGIYRQPGLGFRYKDRHEREPGAIGLGPIRPNPFNPSTTVEYRVPGATEGGAGQTPGKTNGTGRLADGEGAAGTEAAAPVHVRIAIYDVRGRRVRGVVDGERAPGAYAFVWDGRDEEGRILPSGSYLCRIEAGAESETRKMVLAR